MGLGNLRQEEDKSENETVERKGKRIAWGRK
jgi:hypothetical protein